jgi:hypothetical protein
MGQVSHSATCIYMLRKRYVPLSHTGLKMTYQSVKKCQYQGNQSHDNRSIANSQNNLYIKYTSDNRLCPTLCSYNSTFLPWLPLWEDKSLTFHFTSMCPCSGQISFLSAHLYISRPGHGKQTRILCCYSANSCTQVSLCLCHHRSTIAWWRSYCRLPTTWPIWHHLLKFMLQNNRQKQNTFSRYWGRKLKNTSNCPGTVSFFQNYPTERDICSEWKILTILTGTVNGCPASYSCLAIVCMSSVAFTYFYHSSQQKLSGKKQTTCFAMK